MARDTARNSFDWICSGMDTKRPCSLGIDAIRDSSAESWLMGPGAGWPVKYCLSERADPTCKLHFEPTIGIIVTILNFDSLVLKVVLANLPQLVFSFLYFSYNALLTAMLMGYEWVSYAHKRKGLRVSHQPKGAQRCTYFLQLPYRFSIPLLLLSALLHWLVSQSLFLMSIDFYDSLGRPGDYSPYHFKFFGYQTVGFSPPAIIAVLVCGALMTISIVVLGYIPYRRGMPVAGSSSMAISAACHLTAEDGANEGTASSEKLQWGVVTRADNGPGHCAFSPRSVEAPVKGRVYAGSFNPGL
ncbi:unnamed protein product [Alternaria alternata]